MGTLKTMYCPQCGNDKVQVMSWTDVNSHTYQGQVNNPPEEGDFWCDECENHIIPKTLKELWGDFSEISVNNDDEIETDFMFWKAGTSRFEVWHWFDERCPNNLHDDLLYGNMNIEDPKMFGTMRHQLYKNRDDRDVVLTVAWEFLSAAFATPMWFGKREIKFAEPYCEWGFHRIVAIEKNYEYDKLFFGFSFVTTNCPYSLTDVPTGHVIKILKLVHQMIWEDVRTCDNCGKPMLEGYYLGGEHACSDECALALYGGDKKQMEDDLSLAEKYDGVESSSIST